MSEPRQVCLACGRTEVCRRVGRGFPPDVALRRLVSRCRMAGCNGEKAYRAGVSPELEWVLRLRRKMEQGL